MADIVNMYFEYYYYLDIIDNGLYNCYDLNYMERAQADADRIHAELDFVPGSNILLEKLNGKNHAFLKASLMMLTLQKTRKYAAFQLLFIFS